MGLASAAEGAQKPGGALDRELDRLVRREGSGCGPAAGPTSPYPRVADIQAPPRFARRSKPLPRATWAGFQLFYPMPESEVRGSTGLELVESMLAVFREVTLP